MKIRKILAWLCAVLVVLVVIAAGGAYAGLRYLNLRNEKPSIIASKIDAKYYDGASDDLLTGSLGSDGLADKKPPGFKDKFTPQAWELRRNAIYNNYRSLIDATEAGGFGRLMGPNIGLDGEPTGFDGTVAGWEYMAFSTRGKATMMVQVPDQFDPKNPCIVTGPSSGSRGVYGAIGTSGQWGLRHHCAVAYTDKGTGTGADYLPDDIVTTMHGEMMPRDEAGDRANWVAPITDEQRREYISKYPYRFAFKHAHSERNSEMHWGEHVLDSVKFAFYVLNEQYGIKLPGGYTVKTITPENTIVIATSLSNGGGASVRAAEQDTEGLIDGVAVGEPTVQMHEGVGYSISQGDTDFPANSKSLLDTYTFQNLYQPCASLAPENKHAPFNLLPRILAKSRCDALHMKGMLKADDLKGQAEEAQKKINDYGILKEQNILAPSHMAFDVYPNVAVNYAYAYGRFSVLDNLCGYSFAALGDGNKPGPIKREMLETMFAFGSGIPPTNGVQIIYNDAKNGPVKHVAAISPSTGLPDMAFDGALCLRSLVTGKDPATGKPLTGKMLDWHQRVVKGIEEIRNSGNLHGLPAIIVDGRSDAVLPPNHTSRAYYAMNKTVEGEQSNLHYYEITNAQHLDALLQFPGFDTLYVPVLWYAIKGADLMYDHLKNGTPLPPSQVVHTVRRKRGEKLTLKNLTPISENPGSNAIRFSGNHLQVPD